MSSNNFSRRKFLTGAAAVGAVSAMGAGTLASCSLEGGKTRKTGVSELLTSFNKNK